VNFHSLVVRNKSGGIQSEMFDLLEYLCDFFASF